MIYLITFKCTLVLVLPLYSSSGFCADRPQLSTLNSVRLLGIRSILLRFWESPGLRKQSVVSLTVYLINSSSSCPRFQCTIMNLI